MTPMAPAGNTNATVSTNTNTNAKATESSTPTSPTSSSSSTHDRIGELVSYLSHPREDVKKSAVSLLLGLTGTSDGIQHLLEYSSSASSSSSSKSHLFPSVCRLIGDNEEIAISSTQTLINLIAADSNVIATVLKCHVINRLRVQLEQATSLLANASVMLLANLTSNASGARSLLYDGREENEEAEENEEPSAFLLKTLINRFLQTQPEPEMADEATGEPCWDDDYQYVAHILANVCNIQEGRDLLWKNEEQLLPAMMEHLLSPNRVRRCGTMYLLKNLCLADADCHAYFYERLQVVPKLLYLIAGPEPLEEDEKMGLSPFVYEMGEQKQREKDNDICLAIIQIFLLFSTTKDGRLYLQKQQAYPIVRNYHLTVNDETISEEIYKVVDFLIREDEGEGDAKIKAIEKEMQMEKKQVKDDKEGKEGNKTKGQQIVYKKQKNEEEQCLQEEEVEEDIAKGLAEEIDMLNVSSDEEDEEEEPMPESPL